ncbi:MAG: bifunctional folylpolyglutamate synthase/dihydrofolate synthase [Parvibaculales bacterium]
MGPASRKAGRTSNPKTSDTLLARLLDLHPKKIDLSLGRMHRLLASLGHPEKHLPRVVHIAGTNGKGSTLAFLRAFLQAGGYRVNAYTSPHLEYFHERINLGGTPIDEEYLSALLQRCEAANAQEPITFFEITTAAAFCAFAETPADFLLLEVGLGGRLDATNVLRPELSVITPVSIDHQEFLGTTLEEIAAEKLGIVKPGVPVVSAPQEASIVPLFDKASADHDTHLALGGRDWQAYPEKGGMVFQDTQGLLDLPAPALPGLHQIMNAGTAIAAARRLNLPESAIYEGLGEATWPARLQSLSEGALVARIQQKAPHARLWLDGGHNAAAAQALSGWAQSLVGKALKDTGETRLDIILAMLNTKAHGAFLENLKPLAPFAQLHCVPIDDQPNAIAPHALAREAAKAGLTAHAHNGLGAAIDAVPPTARDVLICGSLYLAGQALRANRG